MTHLTEDERIDALDGALDLDRLDHLGTCDTCRASVGALAAALTDLTSAPVGDVPEPSPLFWVHMQRRVREAVSAEVIPVTPWWAQARAWFAVATATAAVCLAVMSRTTPAPPVEDVTALVTIEQVEWQFVTGVLDAETPDVVRDVLVPSTTAVDVTFASLTAKEREAFARLLRAEMSEGSDD